LGASNLTFDGLKGKYKDFAFPQAAVLLGGKEFADKDKSMLIDDVRIELTCGYEASIATFKIFNAFDAAEGKFKFDAIKKQVVLGNPLTIKLGYLGKMEDVFVGFVAGVSFGFDPLDLPYVEVTGLDVKGIMMSGRYACQIKKPSYGEAVREVLQRTAYNKLKTAGGITSIEVTDTPDKQGEGGGGSKATAYTVEMESESDYEFCVKAAKRFNYEFFVDCGKVYFRKAKSNTMNLATLGIGQGIEKFDINYSLTGMVETVEARAMDPGSGKLITSKKKPGITMSTANKAKGLVSKSQFVYIDPTITSQKDADARAAYLVENMSYRLANLDCDCVGIPELAPGRFLKISGMGKPVDNDFYLTTVIHSISSDSGYKTKLVGKAAKVVK
jgi:hypothetical protein